MTYAFTLFGQVYGAGTYNSQSYDVTTSQTGTTAGTGSLLTDTGFDIFLAATVAVTIIFVALIVRFWKRPKTGNTSSQA